MPYIPNDYSDLAIEHDLTYIKNKKRWVLADGITHEVIRVYDTKETAEQAAFDFLCNEGYEPYLYQSNT